MMLTINTESEKSSTGGEGEAAAAATNSSADLVIEGLKVNKIYRSTGADVHALRDVDFSVHRGEIVAVRGVSGSGKTTLLNVLAGLDAATSGTILLSGKNIVEFSDGKLTSFRAKQMGFIFQSFNLLPVLTALENVEFGAILAGHSSRNARRRAKDKLELVGLSDRLGHKPSELSGGQQQRVTIARALVNDPGIVWADEPTGNLDSKNEQEVMDLLVRLNKENNQAFVMVTHSDSVASVAHTSVTMVDGRIDGDE